MNKKPKKAASKIEDAVIVEETNAQGTVIVLDQATKNDIAKFDINKAAITKLKKKYATLTITDINDKAGYKAVDEARKDMWKKGTTLENKRKEIKAEYLQRGRDIDKYAKEIEEIINNGEGGLDHLKALLKDIDDKKKAEADRIEREAAEALQKKVTDLEAAGIAFDGKFYSVGTISLTIDVLKDIEPEGFTILLQNVKNEKFRLDEEKRKADEAEEKRLADIEQQRKDNEQKEQDLKAREERLKAQEEKLLEGRTQGRITSLLGMGLALNAAGNMYLLLTPSGNIEVSLEDVKTEEEEKWAHRMEITQPAAIEINSKETKRKQEIADKEAETQRIATRNAGRVGQLVGLGFIDMEEVLLWNYEGNTKKLEKSEFVTLTDEAFAEWFTETKNLVDNFKVQIDKAIEARRVASLNDVQKANEWLEKLEKFFVENQPSYESENVIGSWNAYLDRIHQASEVFKQVIKS